MPTKEVAIRCNKNSTTFSNFKWLKMTLMTDDDTNRVCIIHGKYVLPMSIYCHSSATDGSN